MFIALGIWLLVESRQGQNIHISLLTELFKKSLKIIQA
jgi:hypothetical protein